MEVDIDAWDPATFPVKFMTVVLGPSGCGKSTLNLSLLKQLNPDIMMAQAWTGTTIDDLRKHVPASLIYQGWRPDMLEEMLKTMGDLKQHAPIDPVTKKKYLMKNLVLLDDVGYDNDFTNKKSQGMQMLSNAGRHSDTTALICLQDAKQMPARFRDQIKLFFIFPNMSPKYVGNVCTEFMTCFEDTEQLHFIFDKVLEQHECLVYDRLAYNQKKPFLFTYKAPADTGVFTVCHDDVWIDYYKHMDRASGAGFMQMVNRLLAGPDPATAPADPAKDAADAAEKAAAAEDYRVFQGPGIRVRRPVPKKKKPVAPSESTVRAIGAAQAAAQAIPSLLPPAAPAAALPPPPVAPAAPLLQAPKRPTWGAR